MIKVTPKNNNESLDSMLKRFNTLVTQDGILKDLKERSHYEKPSAKRRRLKKEKQMEARTNGAMVSKPKKGSSPRM